MSSATKGKGFTTREKPVMGTRRQRRPVEAAEVMPFAAEGEDPMPFVSSGAVAMPFVGEGEFVPASAAAAEDMPLFVAEAPIPPADMLFVPASAAAAAAAEDMPLFIAEGEAPMPLSAAAMPSAAAGSNPASDPPPPVAPVPPVADVVPNYDFPVVYYLITHADMTRSSTLNTYINMQTDACNQHSTQAGFDNPNPPNAATSSRHPFLSSASEICILFMHWDAAHHASVNHESFNDLTFLNQHVLGHAKIRHHPPNLAIYNFCKHTIIPTHGSSRSRTADEDFGKIGISMFNALLTATSFLPDEFNQDVNTLWLGIDVDNVNFSKVARIYTVEGFSNPIITNKDVDATVMQITILQLTRPINNYVNNQIMSMNNFNEVMNLMSQWNAKQRTPVLEYKFRFDRSCILSLHLFPFIVFNTQSVPIGLGHHEGQRETSGTFVVIKSHFVSNDAVNGYDVLSLKTIDESHHVRRIAFNIGQQDTVTATVDEATFHTHPFLMYKRTSTVIGPPSSPDLFSFISTFIILRLSGNTSFKFSLVSTMEGVHVVSFKPNGIRMILGHLATAMSRSLTGDNAVNYVLHEMNDIVIQYEYPDNERRYNWEQQYSINKLKSNRALMEPLEVYALFFDTVNVENGDLFNWYWVDWDNLNTTHEINVEYLDNRIKV